MGKIMTVMVGLRIVSENPNLGWTQGTARDAIIYLTKLKQNGELVIANMSFQTLGIFDEPMPLFASAIAEAKEEGVIMVANKPDVFLHIMIIFKIQ